MSLWLDTFSKVLYRDRTWWQGSGDVLPQMWWRRWFSDITSPGPEHRTGILNANPQLDCLNQFIAANSANEQSFFQKHVHVQSNPGSVPSSLFVFFWLSFRTTEDLRLKASSFCLRPTFFLRCTGQGSFCGWQNYSWKVLLSHEDLSCFARLKIPVPVLDLETKVWG